MYCDALVTLVWTTDLKMFIRVEIQNTLRFLEVPERIHSRKSWKKRGSLVISIDSECVRPPGTKLKQRVAWAARCMYPLLHAYTLGILKDSRYMQVPSSTKHKFGSYTPNQLTYRLLLRTHTWKIIEEPRGKKRFDATSKEERGMIKKPSTRKGTQT